MIQSLENFNPFAAVVDISSAKMSDATKIIKNELKINNLILGKRTHKASV
jgi:hypothetical protein